MRGSGVRVSSPAPTSNAGHLRGVRFSGTCGIDVVAKRIRTKSQRRLTPGRRIVYRLAVWLARLIIEILWRSCRLRVEGKDNLQGLLITHGAIIPVCWHQHLLLCARYLVTKPSGLKPGFMISPSVDGEAPTWLAQSYGAHVVRGSGSYTGLRAVRGAHQAIAKDGISPGVTPDGPRGPRFKFKPGAIFAGQISGKPVVPLAFAAKPAFVLDTWDKFVLPVPFARVTIAIGEPYFPPAEMTSEEMKAAQLEMETRMLETYERASASLAARK
jgi:lysophospholipid acyltransferase (LPLAT)-like uncharacterized protein